MPKTNEETWETIERLTAELTILRDEDQDHRTAVHATGYLLIASRLGELTEYLCMYL